VTEATMFLPTASEDAEPLAKAFGVGVAVVATICGRRRLVCEAQDIEVAKMLTDGHPECRFWRKTSEIQDRRNWEEIK
jgi:hypothetical protein